MFEINDNKDKKVTVRFSESEIEIMEKYMDVNNIKSKTDLIRLALKNLIKQSNIYFIFFGLMEIKYGRQPDDLASDLSDRFYWNAPKKYFQKDINYNKADEISLCNKVATLLWNMVGIFKGEPLKVLI